MTMTPSSEVTPELLPSIALDEVREQIIREIVRGSIDIGKVGWADRIADRILSSISLIGGRDDGSAS